MKTVPVHVVGGFLGAGKTSAVLALLDGPLSGERVAVVVNDFGESAVDEATVAERGIALAEIRGACVCCTAPEGFVGAVAGLLEDPTVDRVLVEPTGLARPADLIDTLRRAPYADRIEVMPLIVLVDPGQLSVEAQTLREQAEAADVLVANRIDRCTAAEIEAFDLWAEGLWPGPLESLHTTMGVLPDSVLRWPDGAGPRASGGHCDHDHDHDHGEGGHGFTARSWVFPPMAVFSRERLLSGFQSLATAGQARAKGLFRTDEGWTRLELAGAAVHEGPTSWRRDSRVDVIGREVGAELEELWSAALLTERERRVQQSSVEVGLLDGSSRRFDRAALAALGDGVADVSGLLPGRQGAAARVSALLDAVGAAAGGSAVVVAADGYTTPPVPVSALRQGLLIHSVGGDALPAAKGGPIRLMIPGDAGPGGPCANVKGVVRIALRN